MIAEAFETSPSDSFREGTERPDAAPFRVHLLDPERAAQSAPAFAGIVALWRERQQGAAVPDWNDFEFADFRGWHAAMLVSDLPDEEPDPLFRIIGEDWRIVPLTGFAGRRFSEVMPQLYQRQMREHFRQIRERGLIGWSVGPAVQINREHLRLQVLELPFRRGGPRVERFAHVLRNGAAAQAAGR